MNNKKNSKLLRFIKNLFLDIDANLEDAADDIAMDKLKIFPGCDNQIFYPGERHNGCDLASGFFDDMGIGDYIAFTKKGKQKAGRFGNDLLKDYRRTIRETEEVASYKYFIIGIEYVLECQKLGKKIYRDKDLKKFMESMPESPSNGDKS